MLYSILIYSGEGIYEQLAKEEQEAVMQGHKDLQIVLKERGQFQSVRLMPTLNAVTLKPNVDAQKKPIVVDGPYSETKEQFLGFYAFNCDTLEEAISLSEMISSPHVTLEIRPAQWAADTLSSDE